MRRHVATTPIYTSRLQSLGDSGAAGDVYAARHVIELNREVTEFFCRLATASVFLGSSPFSASAKAAYLSSIYDANLSAARLITLTIRHILHLPVDIVLCRSADGYIIHSFVKARCRPHRQLGC